MQETLEDERDPGHETLHRPGTLHTFFFPPTRARYVKLAVLQSHDPYQVANLQYFYAGYMEGREITVLISKQSPHPACRRPDDYRGWRPPDPQCNGPQPGHLHLQGRGCGNRRGQGEVIQSHRPVVHQLSFQKCVQMLLLSILIKLKLLIIDMSRWISVSLDRLV